MLESAIQTEEVPGLVAMIVKDGKIVYHTAKGFADVGEGKKMEMSLYGLTPNDVGFGNG
ncbi:MAG: hypothetical protein EBU80_11640, partial [Chitinophagia bacterium]|nr:hypothetical protein [Chitinophagia bacterium]